MPCPTMRPSNGPSTIPHFRRPSPDKVALRLPYAVLFLVQL